MKECHRATNSADQMHKSASNHVFGLDILRIIAALMVSMLHLWGANARGDGGYGAYLITRLTGASSPFQDVAVLPIVFTGSLGVQLFFVISGYVISYSAPKSHSALDFLSRRTLRLVPCLWMCSLISFTLAVVSGFYSLEDGVKRLARSFVLMPIGSHIDDVVWTLVLEAIFYIYVAIHMRKGRRTTPLSVAIALGIVSLIYWSVYFGGGCRFNTYYEGGVCDLYQNHYFQKFSVLALMQHGAFFALGILISQWKVRGNPVVTFCLIATLVSCHLQILWTSQYYCSVDSDIGATCSPLMEFSVWYLLLGLVVISCSPAGRRFRFGGRRAAGIKLLGLSTYPYYLLHGFVGNCALALCVFYRLPTIAHLAGVSLTAGLSIFVVVALEPAFGAALRQLLYRVGSYAK